MMTNKDNNYDNSSQETWEKVQAALSKKRSNLTERKGARDQLIRTKAQEEQQIVLLKDEQQVSYQAHLFLLSEIAQRSEEAIDNFEKMGSAFMRSVYGDGYQIKFQKYEEKSRKVDGASNFKMEILIGSPYQGETLWTGLLDDRGGGAVEVASFAFRIGVLRALGYQGPMLLDEAWKSMSNDDKLDQVSRFLKEVTGKTGRQVIFATHKQDVFGKIAARILQVSNKDGVATVNLISAQDADVDDIYTEVF